MPSQINEMAFPISDCHGATVTPVTANSPSQVLLEEQNQSAGPAAFPF